MELVSWLQIVLVCSLGAMSPGPSLALVLRNTVRGGKSQGILTGIGHGLGMFLYGGLVVLGMSAAMASIPGIEFIFSVLAIMILFWLGAKSLGLKFGTANNQSKPHKEITGYSGFVTGFLIALFNPKIAAFFLAIFTPFLNSETLNIEKVIMALTVGGVDAIWYVTVAFILSGPALNTFLKNNLITIERAMGAVLLFIALGLVYGLVYGLDMV